MSDEIVFTMIKSGFIKKEDEDIYIFGLRQLGSILLDAMIILVIGIIANQLVSLLIFIVVFGTMRRNTGGYHANSRFGCLIISALTEIAAIVLISYFIPEITRLSIISAISILAVSPVNNTYIGLSKLEKNYYRKKTIYLTIFWIVILMFASYSNFTTVASAINVAFIFVNFYALLGWIKSDYWKDCSCVK